MNIDVGTAEERVKDLLPGLSLPQRKFIMARSTCVDDITAAKVINKESLRFLEGWKSKPAFVEAYTLVTQILSPSNMALVVTTKDRDDIVQGQIEALSRLLPKVVGEHVAIIMNPDESSSVKLKAIQMLYDITGLDSGALIRVSRRNKVLVQMLEMLAPQLRSIAEDRNITKSPVEEFIDAQYEEVEIGNSDEDR